MAKELLIGNWWDGTGPLEWTRKAGPRKKFGIPGEACTIAVNYVHVEPHSGSGKDRPQHSHEHEQIMLILEGDGNLICDGVAYPMHDGSYAVIPANVPHKFDASDCCRPNILNIDIFTPTRPEFVTWKEGEEEK